MRAELFATKDRTSFVAAFDMPPFTIPPQVLKWADRTFVRDGDIVHAQECHAVVMSPPGSCTCQGGALAYQEAAVYALADMHQIEKGRDKPVTRKP